MSLYKQNNHSSDTEMNRKVAGLNVEEGRSQPLPASLPISNKQQAYLGQAWLSTWFFLNVFVTISNKAFFKDLNFPYPVTLSLVHMISSAVLSIATIYYYGFPVAKMSTAGHIRIVLFSILFAANIVVGNTGLKFVSVSLVQVVRSVIPAITIALSVIFLGSSFPVPMWLSLIPIVIGAALAAYGEIELDMFGLFLILLVCFLSSFKTVLSNKFLVGEYKIHPMDMLLRMSVLSSIELFFLICVNGELQALSWTWESFCTGSFMLFLIMNGVAAFALNFSNFMTNKLTSPLSITVAGNVKHVVTILISVWYFKNPISTLNAFGTVITIFGAAVYSYLDFVLVASSKPTRSS